MAFSANERDFDPHYNPNFFQILGKWRHWRILFNVVPLLVLGGAVLPLGSAFQITGILSATISMIIIAACMIYTCDLLLWQSLCLGMRDYETLAQAVGGRWYRIFVEVWLVILMIGTLISSVVQVGETCASGILFISPNAPGALVNGSGRVLMVISVVLMGVFVFAKTYRSLEILGDFGFVVVIVMVIAIMVHSIQLGLPAIGNGEFAKIGFKDLDSFGSALSTFGFMFYLQPVMMPMLSEMPPGVYGVRLLSWGAKIAIGGVGFAIYYLTGFFGAAAFGQATEGNILENNLGGNGKAQGALNIFMAVYVMLGLIPFEYACRHAVDSLVVQAFPKLNREKFSLLRAGGEGFLIYAVSLGVALAVPGQSSNIITATGATGVLVVCYFIPVINHYLIWFGRAKTQTDPALLETIVRPTRADDTLSESSETSLQLKTLPHKDFGAENHLAPDWNRPGALSIGSGGEYAYMTGNAFWRAYHLIIPVIVCIVGTFASVLTLKYLAENASSSD